PAHDRAIRAKCRPAPDERVAILILPRHRRPGVVDVREDHTRSAEHVVFQGDVVVHRHVVLNLDVVANTHAIANEDILPARTAFTDHRATAHVDPMPHAGAVPDTRAFVHDRAWMHSRRHRSELQWQGDAASIASREVARYEQLERA